MKLAAHIDVGANERSSRPHAGRLRLRAADLAFHDSAHLPDVPNSGCFLAKKLGRGEVADADIVH